MKKLLTIALACVLLLSVLPAFAQAVAPGGEVTVEFPFSGNASYLVHAKYTIGTGLTFVKGNMEGLIGGKAGKTEAIYVSLPDPAASGKLILTVKAAADAKGDITVSLDSLQGYTPAAKWFDLTGKATKTVKVQAGPVAGIPGDANDNGTVDEFDIAAIIRYLVFDEPCKNMANANANGQGEVDEFDIAWIIGYLIN